ncbi:MAG: hypothetical protein K1X55_17575 [Chitinophagales bacterium]|nr:hypothetical protein [Chitinophagales bacterium]
MKQKVKRFKYLKGNFSGKYRGERIEFLLSLESLSYQIDFYDCEVTDCKEIISETEIEIKSDKIIERELLKDVLVEYPDESKENVFYQEDLEQVKIIDYHFTDVIKDGTQTYGTIKGTIYSSLGYEEEVDVEVAPISVAPVKIVSTKEKVEINQPAKQVVSEQNSGCLPSFGWALSWILLIALAAWLGASGLLAVGLIGLIGWLISKLFTRFPILGTIFSWIIALLYIGLILFSFIYAFLHPYQSHTPSRNRNDNRPTQTTSSDDSEKNNENPVRDDTRYNADSNDVLIKHAIYWRDYAQNKFSDTTKVWLSTYINSKQNRQNINLYLDSKTEWNRLYSTIYNFDKSNLDSLYSMLSAIKKRNNLSSRQFLDVTVSCIQNIPYSKILDYSCEEERARSRSSSYFITDNTACLGNVEYGIQTPNEFLYNLKGDCDTRTLILYTILSYFKYDVVILCSTTYQHSLLGVNIPSYGTYKSFNGKKYYTWETTNPGWMLGQIPPDVSNLYFWDIFMYNSN